MKGIIFVEFVEYLEATCDPEVAQYIINQANVASGGAYSRVGLYDYQELIQILLASAETLELPAGELLQGFTDHLMKMFSQQYAEFFTGATSAADILRDLDSHIHVQVQKLYPDAELPRFEHTQKGKELHLHYTSPRPLAGVANALINSCIKHFDTGEQVIEATIAEDQHSAFFIIR